MRTSPQEQTGSAGLNRVKADFEDIGWGPVPNTEHDLGTDLLVQVQDARGHDLKLIVGVQVKAGNSYFERPVRKDGVLSGWWYREPNAEHFEAWVTHSMPHLLVLHNPDEQVSYWVHVTADAVETTGNGCKILVPIGQKINAEHADMLCDAATGQRGAPALEGTVLQGLPGGIPPQRRLRHALITPRLVAPPPSAMHRNADNAKRCRERFEAGESSFCIGHCHEVDAVEAVALLAQGRFRDLLGVAEQNASVPDPRDTAADSDWAWRFVAAIWEWVMTDSVEELEGVFRSAHTGEAKATSGVVLACALQRADHHDRASDVLTELVDGDDLSSADHGWVLVQRARLASEVGDFSSVRSDAAEAQRSFKGDRDDVTVSPLIATAAWQLFNMAWDPFITSVGSATGDHDDEQPDYGEALTTADTAVQWWRSQTVAQGLTRAASRWFKSWAEESSYTVSYSVNVFNEHLFAAEFNADITGNHGAWQELSALTARWRLMTAADTENESAVLAEGLDALRRSGDSASFKPAVKRLYQASIVHENSGVVCVNVFFYVLLCFDVL